MLTNVFMLLKRMGLAMLRPDPMQIDWGDNIIEERTLGEIIAELQEQMFCNGEFMMPESVFFNNQNISRSYSEARQIRHNFNMMYGFGISRGMSLIANVTA